MMRRLIPMLALSLLATGVRADDWPQWRGPHRDGTWREKGLRDTLPEGQLPLKWSAAISAGYSAPTVAGDRVYVTDHVTEPGDSERILCFDRHTGALAWSHAYETSYAGLSYDAGPRCAVLVHGGRAYSLGAVGHLVCLDAATGQVHWQHDLGEKYDVQLPVWGLAASPIVEKDTLIVPVCGANDAYLVAFDLETGAERWRALPDRGNYSAPIMIKHAGRRVMVIWSGDRILGVDPANGTLLWEHPFPPRNMPLGCASPVWRDDLLFFTGFYDGCVLLRLDPTEMKVGEQWRRRGPNEIRTDGLQSIIATPLILGGCIYGVDSYGQLRCLRLSDGERIWEDLTAVPKARWATIHMVQNGKRTWMFNERGELILAELSPRGFREIGRSLLIEPTTAQLNQRGGVCWAHPAFAHRHVFVRNDEKLVCADLSSAEP